MLRGRLPYHNWLPTDAGSGREIFLNEGDCVLTKNPTYVAAIRAFQIYEIRIAAVPTDDEGLIPEALPALIERERPKFLYTIPNFQIPTGVTLTLSLRTYPV